MIQRAPQPIPPPPPADDSLRPEPPRSQVKSTLADWTAADDDDVNGFYAGEKRQRGGRKKRKKNKEEEHVTQHWDDIYDPSRPNSYEEYKNSDERIAELRDWKDRLYAHRMARRRKSDTISSDDGERAAPLRSKVFATFSFKADKELDQFAPPGISFAPPMPKDPSPPPPPPQDSVPDHPTGEDAYLRRMALTQQPTPLAPPPQVTSPDPPPPVPQSASIASESTISRAPVRYSLPAAPTELPSSEAELVSALESEAQATPHPHPAAAPAAEYS